MLIEWDMVGGSNGEGGGGGGPNGGGGGGGVSIPRAIFIDLASEYKPFSTERWYVVIGICVQRRKMKR